MVKGPEAEFSDFQYFGFCVVKVLNENTQSNKLRGAVANKAKRHNCGDVRFQRTEAFFI
jgi:hypothetical protein